MLSSVSVVDALGDYLRRKKRVGEIQSLACVDKTWQDHFKGTKFHSEANRMRVAANVFITELLHIQRAAETLFDNERDDLRMAVRRDLLRLASATSRLIRILNTLGMKKDMAKSTAKCLHMLAKQRRSNFFLIRFGSPSVRNRFLLSTHSGLCAKHGMCCPRSKRRVAINENYEFQVCCRMCHVDFNSVIISHTPDD